MELGELRTACLEKAGAVEEHPFGPGALVMKVAGKIFAIIGENDDPLTVSLKCEPDLTMLLRDTYEAVRPGYHLSKRHWITVALDGTVDDEALEWLDDSYRLVVDGLTKRQRAALEADTGG